MLISIVGVIFVFWLFKKKIVKGFVFSKTILKHRPSGFVSKGLRNYKSSKTLFQASKFLFSCLSFSFQ